MTSRRNTPPRSAGDLAAELRVWVSSRQREGSFGDGKIRLLQAIEQEGSLQAAAKKLGISYRKAWGDLKNAEACFGKPLLAKTRGGRDGGRTELTDDGRSLVRAFLSFRRKVNAAVQRSFLDFVKAL